MRSPTPVVATAATITDNDEQDAEEVGGGLAPIRTHGRIVPRRRRFQS